MKTAVTMTFMVFLVTMIDLSKTLNCYQCNVKGDKYDPDCEKIDKEKSNFVIKCPENGRKCGTIVTFGNKGDITSRGCLDSYEAHRCEELDDPYVSCEACDEDECNDISATTI